MFRTGVQVRSRVQPLEQGRWRLVRRHGDGLVALMTRGVELQMFPAACDADVEVVSGVADDEEEKSVWTAACDAVGEDENA